MVCACPPMKGRRGSNRSPKKSWARVVSAARSGCETTDSSSRTERSLDRVGSCGCIYNGVSTYPTSTIMAGERQSVEGDDFPGAMMPIFEYLCGECGHKFEAIVFGEQKAECPKCHTAKLEQQLSTFSAHSHGSAAPGEGGGQYGWFRTGRGGFLIKLGPARARGTKPKFNNQKFSRCPFA